MKPDRATQAPYPGPLYAWTVCGVLLLALIFSFLDRSIITLLVIPIEQDLGIGDTELSLIQGFSFALFFALLGLPIARLVDSRSRTAVVAAGVAVWSVMTAAGGLATHFWHLFATRVGLGAGEATLLPGATSLLADTFPPQRRGVALGVFSMGIFVGSGLALILGGILVRVLAAHPLTLPGLGTPPAWRVIFVAVGLPGLLVAALLAALREPRRLGAADADGAAASLPLSEVVGYFRSHARTIACHNLGFTALALAGYAAGAWIPTFFVRVHGWEAGQVGLRFGAVVLVVGPLGCIVGGWLSDRLERLGREDGKLRVGIVAALGALPAGLAFPLAPGPWAALALVAPFFFFISFVWGVAPAALQDIMPNRMRGQAAAVYTAVVNLVGLGVGPTSVALLAEFVLGDPRRLDAALAIVLPLATVVAAVLFRLGRSPFVRTARQARVAAGADPVAAPAET